MSVGFTRVACGSAVLELESAFAIFAPVARDAVNPSLAEHEWLSRGGTGGDVAVSNLQIEMPPAWNVLN